MLERILYGKPTRDAFGKCSSLGKCSGGAPSSAFQELVVVASSSVVDQTLWVAETMDKFTVLTGVAAPLRMINVDTDMIIPKQFLKTIKRTGLGRNLFDELRYEPDGRERPDFVLNRPPYRNASVLIAGDNFGCGSSREHAPWALLDFGVRAIIAPSFADIFFNNCFKNGILPIVLPQDQVDLLMKDAENGANAVFSIDLEKQEISRPDGGKVAFNVDPFRKHCLLCGLDDIGLTLQHVAKIDAFETSQKSTQPWLWA
ncbi:3-isopropylmalate/(R)-2-methylmalate dehydratase small subunit [Azospirillaceae bacterium]